MSNDDLTYLQDEEEARTMTETKVNEHANFNDVKESSPLCKNSPSVIVSG